MAPPKVTLYVDIVSPFAYIAFHVLKNSSTFAKCEVTYVPIFLGGLFQQCGNLPPLNIKNGSMRNESDGPNTFPSPSATLPPRASPSAPSPYSGPSVSLPNRARRSYPAAIEALYHSFWVQSNSEIGKPAGFGPILESVLGPEATKEVLNAITQPEVKALLSANTDRAFKAGAFGLPWFECTNAAGEQQGFWGIDHLGQVVDFLGLERGKEAGFKALL
ncbi:hypothetical protein POX_b02327 [Penicillium oxalicum]|uniref:hypothetical protein n=1 Tax=Penicillium oxalicum TaxID=69781 RepID=UPI0020B7D999|nr:hypothetical protein POX_b02327 [Penicillium oxalicum]KAI2792290.1 hypothetical protein POX_b02327 [Penicillium oxalicum]